MCANTHTYIDTDTDMCITMPMINYIDRGMPLTEAIHEYDSDMNQNEPFSSRLPLGQIALHDTMNLLGSRQETSAAVITQTRARKEWIPKATKTPDALARSRFCCWRSLWWIVVAPATQRLQHCTTRRMLGWNFWAFARLGSSTSASFECALGSQCQRYMCGCKTTAKNPWWACTHTPLHLVLDVVWLTISVITRMTWQATQGSEMCGAPWSNGNQCNTVACNHHSPCSKKASAWHNYMSFQ